MSEAIVCGAGAAGLASAACLKRVGIPVTVLERGDALGTSWRRRYDGLRLNTPAGCRRCPATARAVGATGEFPARDDWVRYLEDYARDHGIEPQLGTDVQRVDMANGGWRVESSTGFREARSW